MIPHPKTVAEPGEKSAKTFFEIACPSLLQVRREAGRGRCAFEVVGTIENRWVLDFEHGTVESGAKSADLTLRLSDDDFVSWLEDRLDIGDALQTGRLIVSGDHSLLEQLRVLFTL